MSHTPGEASVTQADMGYYEKAPRAELIVVAKADSMVRSATM